MQVRPQIHAQFHQHIEAQLHALGSHGADATARKRKSDAKIIAAICEEMQERCSKDEALRQQAGDEFAKYQEVLSLPVVPMRIARRRHMSLHCCAKCLHKPFTKAWLVS